MTRIERHFEREKRDSEMDLTESQERNMLLREEVVAVVRKVIEQNPHIPKTSQLLNALRYRETAEMGVSKAEIAKAFFPDVFERSYFNGCVAAYRLISSLMRSPKGRWAVIHAAKVPFEGYGEKWVYYNMQSEDDPNYKKLQRHRKTIVDSMEEKSERLDDWFQIDLAERKRRIEEKTAALDHELEKHGVHICNVRARDIDIRKHVELLSLEDEYAKKAGARQEMFRKRIDVDGDEKHDE